MKTLVVFYSRSGRSQIVAEELSRRMQADLEQIIPQKDYRGLFGFFRAGYQSTTGKTPAINPRHKNWLDYDLIILGTPIWAGHISAPLRTAITDQSQKIKKYAIFCTAGSTDPQRVLTDVRQLLNRDPVTLMVFSSAEVSRGQTEEKIRDFINKISAG